MTLPLFSRHASRKRQKTSTMETSTGTGFASSPSSEDAALLCSISSTSSTPTAGNISEKTDDGNDSGSKPEPEPEPEAPVSSPPNKPESMMPQPQQQYVDHSYTDYAKVDEDDLSLMKAARAKAAGAAAAIGNHATNAAIEFRMMKNKGSSVMMPFPGKLLEVLDRGDLSSIIDWMPHGRAFIVKQPKVFTTQVLPRFFKQTKFLSFTRQLNLWGFKRITRGLDAGAYYHELFLPGRPNLAMRMKRQKIKGTGIRPIPNPEQEPNFYYEYPHVAKVPMSSVPIPLPPLPSERIATLMGGTQHNNAPMFPEQGGILPRQQMQAQPVLRQSFANQGQSANLEGLANLACNLGSDHGSLSINRSMGSRMGMSLPSNTHPSSLIPSKSTLSAAAEAEHRLHGSIKPGAASSFSNLNSYTSESRGLPMRLPSARPAPYAPASAPGGLDSVSDLYIRQASMSSAAPRDYAPLNDDEDEVSSANRRLMERLLNQTTSAPAPRDILQRSENAAASLLRRPSYQTSHLLNGARNESHQDILRHSENAAATLLRRPSYQMNRLLNGAENESSLLGRSMATPQPSVHDPVRRESFKLQQSPASLFPRDFDRYMHHSRASSMPSSMPSSMGSGLSASRHQEVDVSTVTNALREAQRLEEMARSQRDNARALAGALQQRMGGRDITLPLSRGDFMFDDLRGDLR